MVEMVLASESPPVPALVAVAIAAEPPVRGAMAEEARGLVAATAAHVLAGHQNESG